jgi:hypothetical protein
MRVQGGVALGIPSYHILVLKPFIERLHITFTRPIELLAHSSRNTVISFRGLILCQFQMNALHFGRILGGKVN